MTVLLAVVALALAVALLVVYRRLQDAEYWRAHWSRRYGERDAELSAALSEGQELKSNVEHALRILWRRVEVVTPADGAAVAFLRAAFPMLPAPPGPRVLESLPGGKHKHAEPLSAVTCPKCEDASCVAPGQCDNLFGGDAP
ncbi:hypothetical protein [Myxococcus virescens]|uniref:Uncharacterized protein n=1 Tax=Myxococcus virescens TaxID=83456 RepID=A0A511HP47_9BACT|nr:hypothetical protein [Myxococcus virescens]GEL75371.1 hypothetical protein MVI01_71550 [Myxococcus virescens]SDE65390.1 hypothetical protein SAMN04488504_109287 [Myxococcus virescens]